MNYERDNMRSHHRLPWTSLLSLGIILFIFSILVLAAVPPVSRDALTHHLAIPKVYLQHGQIFEIPALNFSYYPMNLDLLYMVPLAWGNDIIPKYIHFSFALLTAFLLYGYLKKKIGADWGRLAALFFLSIPIITKLSITVYVDLGLIFFTTASLLLLFRWIEEGYKTRFLILSALCCGLAVGTKYNGLISLLILSALTPILYARSQTRPPKNTKILAYALLFMFVAVATASPWFIRNYIWTGNPLYPLFQKFFQPETQQAHSGGLGIFATRHLVFGETPLQIALLPFRVFFQGQDNNPQYFDGKLNPFLLFLPLAAFLCPGQTKILRLEKRTMVVFSTLFFFFAMFQTGMRVRYIAPIIPFLVILSIFGIHSLHSLLSWHLQNRSTTLFLTVILILTALSYNMNYLVGQFRLVQPLSYLSGRVDRESYITRFRPEYPVIQYANRQKNISSKTLCLFLGNRGYYMDFPHIFDVPTSKGSLFSRLLSRASDASTLAKIVREMGINRILLRNDLVENWIRGLKEHRRIVTFFFQDYLQLMYTANGYTLFEIRPPSITRINNIE